MLNLKNLKNKKRGFTLIELIVVIAILGILAAILVPSMMGILSTANSQRDESNARAVYSAAKAAYVQLSTAGTAPAAGDYDSTDTDAIITDTKTNLGSGFGSTTFSITVTAGGDISATCSGKTYPK